MRRLPLALLLAGPMLAGPALAPGALAQGTGIGRNAPPPSAGPASRPPPPALPGLANRRAAEPIPAETPSVNLRPNEALFDAINRGDMAAARDAVARGADLNARNQLGLTPVDAAVDQGRNEIVFYLLSTRGSTGTGPTMAPAEPAPPPAARRGRPGRDAAPAAPAESALLPPQEPPARPSGLLSDPPRGGELPAGSVSTGTATTARARLFAGDGGMPRPEIGFLGFDAGRPAGAAPLPASTRPSAPSRRGRRA
ncbi:ankyrin repeat domain-containing protein [Roseomonas sp. SSH11]|uniref:Ankyrin repeat domain-containing protein n=1 Tax=Pararoseomonas baculiformis TaxID=2820812 RepID=A0ABS4A8V1_9PROT|nr:ankyrin repeat domain-containing protein [Pararoseomonas baculiformis]MBP0443418.1 ankyrin repeat domain-containing protein [Pararoseomonas baculiformis]